MNGTGIHRIPFWRDPSVNPSADPAQFAELLAQLRRATIEREGNPLSHARGVHGKLSLTYESGYEVKLRELRRK